MKKPIFDLEKTWRCNASIILLFDGISLPVFSAVWILSNPSRQFWLSFPLNLTPPIMLFSIRLPVVSLARPILREKKGIASRLLPKFPKRSLLSMKNCFFRKEYLKACKICKNIVNLHVREIRIHRYIEVHGISNGNFCISAVMQVFA